MEPETGQKAVDMATKVAAMKFSYAALLVVCVVLPSRPEELSCILSCSFAFWVVCGGCEGEAFAIFWLPSRADPVEEELVGVLLEGGTWEQPF